ncbi:unannotated protein [freshwater metagenome]|uniref:Unannotated protein n=1 Tax=freshwater metagenome TaxID=449393 RepID=A0A6J6MVJ5_9ZZZZ
MLQTRHALPNSSSSFVDATSSSNRDNGLQYQVSRDQLDWLVSTGLGQPLLNQNLLLGLLLKFHRDEWLTFLEMKSISIVVTPSQHLQSGFHIRLRSHRKKLTGSDAVLPSLAPKTFVRERMLEMDEKGFQLRVELKVGGLDHLECINNYQNQNESIVESFSNPTLCRHVGPR